MSLLFSPARLPLGLVEFVISPLKGALVERVRQIVKFWGEDEGVEMARVVEVASPSTTLNLPRSSRPSSRI